MNSSVITDYYYLWLKTSKENEFLNDKFLI